MLSKNTAACLVLHVHGLPSSLGITLVSYVRFLTIIITLLLIYFGTLSPATPAYKRSHCRPATTTPSRSRTPDRSGWRGGKRGDCGGVVIPPGLIFFRQSREQTSPLWRISGKRTRPGSCTGHRRQDRRDRNPPVQQHCRLPCGCNSPACGSRRDLGTRGLPARPAASDTVVPVRIPR